MAGRRRVGPFRYARAEDQEVLVDGARRVREHVEVADVAAKPLEQRDTAIRAEGRDGLAGARVERVEPLSGRHEDAAIVTALPEDDPAVHAERTDALAAGTAAGKRVEHPQLAPRRRVERKRLQRGRRAVEHAVHHDRVALDLGAVVGLRVARAVRPRDLQRAHVPGVDLVEGGELAMTRIAAVRGPIHRRCSALGRAARGAGQHHASEHEERNRRAAARSLHRHKRSSLAATGCRYDLRGSGASSGKTDLSGGTFDVESCDPQYT